ncbi:hypothetical protein MRX96_030761 [Rhipicephalus microplus]
MNCSGTGAECRDVWVKEREGILELEDVVSQDAQAVAAQRRPSERSAAAGPAELRLSARTDKQAIVPPPPLHVLGAVKQHAEPRGFLLKTHAHRSRHASPLQETTLSRRTPEIVLVMCARSAEEWVVVRASHKRPAEPAGGGAPCFTARSLALAIASPCMQGGRVNFHWRPFLGTPCSARHAASQISRRVRVGGAGERPP